MRIRIGLNTNGIWIKLNKHRIRSNMDRIRYKYALSIDCEQIGCGVVYESDTDQICIAYEIECAEEKHFQAKLAIDSAL
ncbi:hypothetical protein Trydic_g14046 [Trypoxylus dichotomus]